MKISSYLRVIPILLALLLFIGCSGEDQVTSPMKGYVTTSGTSMEQDPAVSPDGYDFYDAEGYVETMDYENLRLMVNGEYYYADEYTEIDIDGCYLDYPSFAEIYAGDYVKIEYGSPMDDPGYYARKIQVIRDHDYYDVEGYVEAIDYDGMRLMVMGEYYWADACTGIDIDDCYADYPVFADIYEGDYVKVEYRSEVDDAGYYSRKIQVIRDFDYYDVEGYVEAIDYENMQLMVGGQYYWADGCTGIDFSDFGYGTFDQIVAGDYVKVEYRSEMDDMGYYARKIQVMRDYDYYDVEGYVESIDYENMRLMVMGQYYYADEYTEIDIDDCYLDYPTFTEIREGDYVKIEYRNQMNDMGYYARKIQVERDYDYYDVMGYVESIDYESRQLMVMGQYYWTDACTEINIDDCEYPAFDQITEGDYVKIEYRSEMDEELGYYAKKIDVKRDDDDDDDDDDHGYGYTR